MLKILYPEGKSKALTFSYDDGQIHDKRLVELFNRYGLKGTFHLNSGRLGQKDFLDAEEVAALYGGHEVSCHGVKHLFLNQLAQPELVHELLEDRRALEQLSDGIVTGLSYAFGVYNNTVVDTAQMLGIEYARTIEDTGNFFVPNDFMRWHPTAHHQKLIEDEKLIEMFLNPPFFMRPELLYIWGHSYEFEMRNNWDAMERLCQRLAGHDDIWYTTNIDYCRYRKAVSALVYDAELTRVYNPSAVKIWAEKDGEIITL